MVKAVSLSDSLVITLFSMIVVFVVLVAIAYLIDILRLAVNGREKKEERENLAVDNKKDSAIVPESQEEKLEDKELVAVIAAAIAASLGVELPQINIKTIRRVSSSTPAWSEAGRREQILEKI